MANHPYTLHRSLTAALDWLIGVFFNPPTGPLDRVRKLAGLLFILLWLDFGLTLIDGLAGDGTAAWPYDRLISGEERLGAPGLELFQLNDARRLLA